MTENNDNRKGQKKKWIIMFLIIILLGINAFQFFTNMKKTQTIQTQEQTIKGQEENISGMMTKLDSVETELNLKRQEILRLGGKVTELDAILAEVRADKEKLLKERNLAVADVEKYKDRIEALTVQLDVSDKKIAQLTSQRDSLFKFNQRLEKRMEQRSDSMKQLTYTQKKLEQKVAVASALKAENIQVDALTDRGKLKEGPDLKARHIYKLRVSFSIGENRVAITEGKDIYLRIVEPDGSAIYDMALGGGMFNFEGKDIPFTLRQNILFENKQQRFSFYFLKGSPYKTGNYLIELYSEGFKIGEQKFTIN